MKPRSGVAKRPRYGKTVACCRQLTPNHLASVAEYWSTDGGGDPAAGAGVVGAVDGEGGEGAVDLLAGDAAAEDQLVVAPAVVGAAAGVDRERAAEVGGGELGDAVSTRRAATVAW